MDKVSEKYKKYLIEIKLNGKKKLFVGGMDTSKNDDDFLLLDQNLKILVFDSFDQIEKFIKGQKNLLDEDSFHHWIQEFKSREPYITYDLSNIIRIVKESGDINDLKKDELSKIVDLINIIGDYAYQIDFKDLVLLYENKYIDRLKTFFMDMYMWKIQESQKVNLEKLSDFSYSEFKIAFESLCHLFMQQFSNYNPDIL